MIKIIRSGGNLNNFNNLIVTMYIVYMTTCAQNNKIYIGVHKTESDEYFDGYLGCGVNIYNKHTYKKPKTPFQCAVMEFGFKSFKRQTIAKFDTREEAYKLEKELVTREFVQDPMTYNMMVGGTGGYEYRKGSSWFSNNVYLYDLEGNFVQEFTSVTDTCKFIEEKIGKFVNISHVSRAAKTGYQFHGYQVSFIKLPYMKKFKKKQYEGPRIGNVINHKFENHPIGRFDVISGEILEIFSCLTECRKAGYENAKKVISGERKKCKGFYFRYLTENEISKYNINVDLSYKELHNKLNK